VGIGTSSPKYKLQVQSGHNTILAGADSGLLSLTDATQKVMRFGVPHYTNAEEPVAGMFVSNLLNENGLFIGGGTGVFNAATRVSFYTAANTTTTTGTERMRIDSAGNVGIGTSSPDAKLRVLGSATVSSQVNVAARIGASVDSDLLLGSVNGNTPFVASQGAFPLAFYTNATERARIDSSGRLLVGQTSDNINAQLSVATSGNGFHAVTTAAGNVAGSFERNNVGILVNFRNNGSDISGAQIYNNTTSVSYATGSDYRLKHDIQPMTGALAKVAQLKPVTYKWNADDSQSQGFIAHELQEVVPECVTGEKDAVDADGKPVYQGIDTSFLVATLTAALQEAVAEINSLKTRIEALEGTQP
jgi:hypothetical protein